LANARDILHRVFQSSLLWSQEAVTREEALSAEQQIKGWRRKKKEAMMRGDWAEVSRLAKSNSLHPSTSSGRTDLLLRDAIKND
jgi:putative endonuclease